MATHSIGAGGHARTLGLLSFEVLGGAALTPVSFTLREAVNETYEAKVLVHAHEPAEHLAPVVLGQPARLGFGGEPHGGSVLGVPLGGVGGARYVGGIVRAIESRGTSSHVTGAPYEVELTVVPKLALLANRKTSRVFQDLAVTHVVDAILDEWGVARRWAIGGRLPVWLYNVQHQESDLDFIKRILAAEGVFFYFERSAHGPISLENDDTRVVFGDSAAAWRGAGEGPVPELFPSVRNERTGHKKDRLFRFSETQRIGTHSVFLRDHSITHAHADSVATASASRAEHRLHTTYEYLPARPVDVMPRIGAVALEQLRRDVRVVSGEASSAQLVPGHAFHVERLSDATLDGTYVVTSLRTRGNDHFAEGESVKFTEGAQAESEAIFQELDAVRDADVFRPRRIHRDAHHALDTAVVVGPPNTPAICDSLGRVRVRFSWDHERPGMQAEVEWSERSTWLPVAQPWNGAGHGAFFLPRVGSEVLVGFIGGDINRPVVVGSLPNSAQPPPFSLPADIGSSGIVSRGLAGEGQSELVFDDTGGRESARLVSQRRLELTARQDLEHRAGRNELTDVTEESVMKVGHARREIVRGARTISVAGKSSFEVTNDAQCTVTGATQLSVAAMGVHVREDATLAFDRRFESKHAGDIRLEVAGVTSSTHHGPLFVRVGGHDEPAAHILRVEGSSSYDVTDILEIASDKEIVLRSGKSSVRIGPEAVQITTPKLRVDAADVEVVGDTVQIEGKKFSRIEGAKVFALSRGASLCLTAEVKVHGAQVKLGSPPDPSDGAEAQKREPPPTRIKLVDQDGRPVAGEACIVRCSDGTSRAAVTDHEGFAVLHDLEGSATVDFIDLSHWENG